MTVYGYARCSTNETMQDITRQVRELKSLGATDTTIYKEYMSGTRSDRPEFNKLMNIVQDGDSIVVTEVSRLSRSTRQLIDILEVCEKKHLKLVIQNSMTIDCSSGAADPMTKAFLQMAGVFAELERNMISERVKSGMANGKPAGRRSTKADDIPETFKKYYKQYRAEKINMCELSRLAQVSRQTAYKYVGILDSEVTA